MTVLLSALALFTFSAATPVQPICFEPPVPALSAQKKTKDGPIVLKVDERTKQPLGPMVKPRGLLLDPRDLPDKVLPYLNAAKGLEGLEGSLTALFAKNLGFAIEGKKLPKVYRKFAKTQRDNWNSQVSQFSTQLDPANIEMMAYAAVYHDTGRRIFPDKNEMHVVSVPDIQLLPIPTEKAEQYMHLDILISEFGTEMEASRAEELQAITQPMMDASEDPWFDHSMLPLMMLSQGMWDDKYAHGEIFKMTTDEYMDRIKRALKEAIVDPIVPKFPGNHEDGVLYYYEGLAVIRIAPTKSTKNKKDKSIWKAPKALIDHNDLTANPMLLIEVPEASKYTLKSKHKQIQISMIAGSREKELYSGRFPLK
ncbi:MAG: hypothetical protein JKY61_06985 [Planctomycetes bacterium]|nr:hypothetical protein [Planctomycetota bacterium]